MPLKILRFLSWHGKKIALDKASLPKVLGKPFPLKLEKNQSTLRDQKVGLLEMQHRLVMEAHTCLEKDTQRRCGSGFQKNDHKVGTHN